MVPIWAAMQAFASGEAAMHIQSTSVYSSMKAAAKQGGWELTGYPMPGFDGKSFRTYEFGKLYCSTA